MKPKPKCEIVPSLPHQPEAVATDNRATILRPVTESSVLGHYVSAIRRRIHLRIDGLTTQVATAALRLQVEHLKLVIDRDTTLGAFRLSELEREVRAAELEQRMEDIRTQRRLNHRLLPLRHQKEQMALILEVGKLRNELRQAKTVQQKLTMGQQRLIKKTEIEGQLQELETEEARAVQRAGSEEGKRRLQNMYANRKERLLEQLENCL